MYTFMYTSTLYKIAFPYGWVELVVATTTKADVAISMYLCVYVCVCARACLCV